VFLLSARRRYDGRSRSFTGRRVPPIWQCSMSGPGSRAETWLGRAVGISDAVLDELAHDRRRILGIEPHGRSPITIRAAVRALQRGPPPQAAEAPMRVGMVERVGL